MLQNAFKLCEMEVPQDVQNTIFHLFLLLIVPSIDLHTSIFKPDPKIPTIIQDLSTPNCVVEVQPIQEDDIESDLITEENMDDYLYEPEMDPELGTWSDES